MLPDSERRPELTPREQLANELQGEYRGSIKIQALADYTSLNSAIWKVDLLRLQKNSDPLTLMDASTDRAAIQETVRGKEFGEDSTEYLEASPIVLRLQTAYISQLTTKNLSELEGVDYYTKSIQGASSMLTDLSILNAQLPKKGETQAKPLERQIEPSSIRPFNPTDFRP
jgi:hypothetical protein